MRCCIFCKAVLIPQKCFWLHTSLLAKETTLHPSIKHVEVPRTDAGLRILQGREVRGPLLRDRASQCNAWRWTSFKVSRQDLHKAMAAATISSYGPCGFRPPACIDPFPLSLPLSLSASLSLCLGPVSVWSSSASHALQRRRRTDGGTMYLKALCSS